MKRQRRKVEVQVAGLFYVMGKCQVCGKETEKVLFKKAAVKTYICSVECLQKYFAPIGGVKRQVKLVEDEGWLD